MAHAHDFPVRGVRAVTVRADGHAVAARGQGVIAASLQRVREATVDRASIVADPRCLAMHERARRDDLPAELLHDALMPEADTEDGDPAREILDHGQRHAGVGGTPGPGRDHQVRGVPYRLAAATSMASLR